MKKKVYFIFESIETFIIYRTSAYQHYSYSSHSHYPQAAYAAHYPYAPQSTATAGTTAATTATTTTAATTTQPQASSSSQQRMDAAGSDITTLNDALGSAGVDLRVSSLSSLSLNLFLNNHNPSSFLTG